MVIEEGSLRRKKSYMDDGENQDEIIKTNNLAFNLNSAGNVGNLRMRNFRTLNRCSGCSCIAALVSLEMCTYTLVYVSVFMNRYERKKLCV